MRAMQDQLRQRPSKNGQSDQALLEDRALLSTTDATCGTSNLAMRPRAGNISSDTRAG